MAAAIPTRIREARTQAGLTREQMAPLVGVTLRTLGRYETGETTRISVETMARIAEATGKPLAFFLEAA